ncbi:dolichyl-phosphate-mannose--protein mannosyltransferase [uncultured Tessaracoccus sp.]|uniref:dolichyl-phosphate-mannose--protein mannosyltransferase n=1 Tax=uncultured Tessaracoccus sp. TaxID=905023 RepID=UPI00260038AB|nr:phospholipid carrier-dependent glycosyltransferase [uncultured Tessaracoccus sp.]
MTTIEALEEGRLRRDELLSWGVTSAITAFAFVLRLVGLGQPHQFAFDETYYAKDAWAIMQRGHEMEWTKQANDLILQGNIDQMQDQAAFVVHPPLGKLLIGWGELAFGFTPFGWRVASLVAGTLLVLFTIRLARRLARSTLVGALAGVLLAVDGLAFVMSRLALLDIFQATFAVAGVSALVADRDWFRAKLAAHLRRHHLVDLDGGFGPWLPWRPWRVLAGICLGASVAVKWNSLFLVAVFGIVTVCWDVGARRLAGAGGRAWRSLIVEAPLAFVQLVVVGAGVYLASWWRWFTSDGGYARDFWRTDPDSPLVQALGPSLGSLAYYHQKIYEFHTGAHMMQEATHTYEAHPAGWLFMIRTTGIAAENGIKPGEQGCEAVGTTCLRVVSALGTPLLWWAGAIALVIGLWLWLARRDWRFSVPILALASTWLPWFRYADRPLFFFYAIMIIPFTVTVLAMVLVRALGPADHPRRRARAIAVGIVVGLIVWNFAFIHPVLTHQLLTRPEWMLRMWLGTWI